MEYSAIAASALAAFVATAQVSEAYVSAVRAEAVGGRLIYRLGWEHPPSMIFTMQRTTPRSSHSKSVHVAVGFV